MGEAEVEVEAKEEGIVVEVAIKQTAGSKARQVNEAAAVAVDETLLEDG
jgi:hypothetical protein